MTKNLSFKLKNLASNWMFWLIVITGAAIIVRSFPAWTNAAWGCDFGIYFGLTKDFVETGELFNPYYGWGSTYNYFPVLYTITGFLHWISGIDVLTIMIKTAPIFGGLTVLVFYFLAYELYNNKKIAILSSLLLAVIPFHVYQTSHASPLTMGHFFMILSLFFFLKYRKNSLFIYPLFFSTVLLIMSHHLTTYFYLITLVMVLFFENASRDKWTLHIKKDIIYVIIATASVFLYWIFIATPVFEGFLNSAFKFIGINNSSFLVIIVFYILFFLLFPISRIARKISKKAFERKSESNNFLIKLFSKIINKLDPFIKKELPSARSRLSRFIILLIICIGFLSLFIKYPLPWTGFPIAITAIILSIPMLAALSLALVGFRYSCINKSGYFLRGWFFAIIFSLFFSVISQNNKLFPHRHFEYLMYPISILAIFGIGGIFSDHDFKTLFSLNKNKLKKYIIKLKSGTYKKQNIFIIFFSLLIITNALTVYPSHEALEQSWEKITSQDIYTFMWIDKNIDKNDSLLVSDHRLERMAESYGFNTTQDEIIDLWESENISEYFNELYGINSNHGKVTHIIIDDIMVNHGVHIGPKKLEFRTLHMTNETWTGGYDKFKEPIFIKIYRNESIEINQETQEAVHFAEIFKVNWTYIEDFLIKK